VTKSNTLTIAIKEYSRGIDFKDYGLLGGLYVVQAYLPQSFADFNQCKGRTARAGKLGRFKVVINL
jgi:superfamily II DNA/RNA helicase